MTPDERIIKVLEEIRDNQLSQLKVSQDMSARYQQQEQLAKRFRPALLFVVGLIVVMLILCGAYLLSCGAFRRMF